MSLEDLFPGWPEGLAAALFQGNVDPFGLDSNRHPRTQESEIGDPSPFGFSPRPPEFPTPKPFFPQSCSSSRKVSDYRAEEEAFRALLKDPTVVVNPVKLGFIPRGLWSDEEVPVGQVIESFFQRRSSVNGRFHHKLFNALRIVEEFPTLAGILGVSWATDKILRVDKMALARVLAITAIDGSLFHQQGNFPSHGFIELSQSEARELCPWEVLEGADFDRVRMLTRPDGVFVRGCSAEEVEELRRIVPKKVV
jgi:hypothetical protein